MARTFVITQNGTSRSFTLATGVGPRGATGATGAPGTTDYNELDNVPTEFPPSAHDHVVSDITPVSGRHLIGRHANGNGDAQEVTVSGGLEFSGSGIRRAALTGDVTASAGSDSTTLANVGTAGTYRSVTTDAKGRVTAGTNPTTLDGYGITDAAAAVHTHVSDDITDATDNAVAGKIAKYTSSSGLFALGLELYNGTGNTEFQAEAGADDYTINVPAEDGTLALTSDLTAKANLTGGNTFSGTQSNTGEVRSSAALAGDTTQLPNLAQADERYGRIFYAAGEIVNSSAVAANICQISNVPAGTYFFQANIHAQTQAVETMNVLVGISLSATATMTRRTHHSGVNAVDSRITGSSGGGSNNAIVSVVHSGASLGRGNYQFFGEIVRTTSGTVQIYGNNVDAGKGDTTFWGQIMLTKV
jgi:phage-related tail fiber protein